MKGYRFYSDSASTYAKRHNKHRGSVIAIDLDDRGRPIGRMHHTGKDYMIECTAGMFDWPDSGVGGTSVSQDYLRKRCKRIPEKLAREIHPALFAWLDSFDENGRPKQKARSGNG